MVEAPAAIIGVQHLGQVFIFVGAFAIFRDQMIAIASLLCLVQVVMSLSSVAELPGCRISFLVNLN
jgi:hypothetical protein